MSIKDAHDQFRQDIVYAQDSIKSIDSEIETIDIKKYIAMRSRYGANDLILKNFNDALWYMNSSLDKLKELCKAKYRDIIGRYFSNLGTDGSLGKLKNAHPDVFSLKEKIVNTKEYKYLKGYVNLSKHEKRISLNAKTRVAVPESIKGRNPVRILIGGNSYMDIPGDGSTNEPVEIEGRFCLFVGSFKKDENRYIEVEISIAKNIYNIIVGAYNDFTEVQNYIELYSNDRLYCHNNLFDQYDEDYYNRLKQQGVALI
jgi:hypothetical protein